MTRLWIVLSFVLINGAGIGAQTSVNDFKSHVLWERELTDGRLWLLSGATSDKAGGLWFVADDLKEQRLVHFAPNGDLLSSGGLPQALAPKPPAEILSVALAVTPSGRIGLLANYSHAVGKAIYEDGASFASIEGGKVSVPSKIAGPGPEYLGFVALSDDHFLVMGDQEPLVLTDIDSQGKKIWRRAFWSKWDLPSGAALDNGASCIATSEYAAPRVRVLRLDASGGVQRQADISARGALAAAGPEGDCAVLYQREPGFKRSEFFLTVFDSAFKRKWTVPVTSDAPAGGSYYLVGVSDGYVVVAETLRVSGALFMAKYDFSGRLLWTVTDESRRAPDLVVPDGDGFYLVGAGWNGHTSLSVIRAH